MELCGTTKPIQPVEKAKPVRMPKRLSYDAACLQNIGKRKSQQDSFAFCNALDVTLIRQEGLFAIVADGMGGLQEGKKVSSMAVEDMQHAFTVFDRKKPFVNQIKIHTSKLNTKIRDCFQGKGGTTLIAAIIYEEQLSWVSVGDSSVYLFRENMLYRLNTEHNLSRRLCLEAFRNKELDISDIVSDPNGAKLTDYVGMPGQINFDSCVTPLKLSCGDKIVLCTDGVAGVLSENELLACMSSLTSSVICQTIDEAIQKKQKNNQDNYTALVISCIL